MTTSDISGLVTEAACRAQRSVRNFCSFVRREFFCRGVLLFGLQTPSSPSNTTQNAKHYLKTSKNHKNDLKALEHIETPILSLLPFSPPTGQLSISRDRWKAAWDGCSVEIGHTLPRVRAISRLNFRLLWQLRILCCAAYSFLPTIMLRHQFFRR